MLHTCKHKVNQLKDPCIINQEKHCFKINLLGHMTDDIKSTQLH